VNPQQTASEATAATATDVVLAASTAPTKPIVPKTTLSKATAQTQAGTAVSDEPEAPAGTADPSATATSSGTALKDIAQPAAAGKPKTDGIVETAKADRAAGSSPASAGTLATHAHTAAAGAGPAPTNSSDSGVLATSAFQPQLNATSAALPSGSFSVTAATGAAVPLSGLAVEIAASANSGKSRFEIRLDPADLGRIDVRIDVDRNGQVTSHLTVEKPETLSMLRQDAPQLQRALDDAGLRTGNGGLQFSLRDQSSSGQDNGQGSGRNAQRLVIEEDTIPAVVAGRTYGRMLGSSSGVDIKV
jgi:flagellar hook-length control protein FliK